MRVVDIPGHVPDLTDRISNDAVRQVLEDLRLDYLVTVPESLYEVLLKDVIQKSSMKIVQVCRESQGISICSGLTYGGKKAAILCSFKGLYNSIDSILGVALHCQVSFLMLLSEASAMGKKAADNPERGCHTASLLKALDIPYFEVSSDKELFRIKEAAAQTENNTQPVAVILRW
ncbi:MAG: comD [Deltaproteobacteria bacterium]|nr:comD [Deltaproteobacteria bacterium]